MNPLTLTGTKNRNTVHPSYQLQRTLRLVGRTCPTLHTHMEKQIEVCKAVSVNVLGCPSIKQMNSQTVVFTNILRTSS